MTISMSRPTAPVRLPSAAHPGRVRLQVGDMDRSLRYYEGLLGFHVLDQSDSAAVLGDGERPLIELVQRTGARRVAPRSRLGLFHVAYLLPDRDKLARFVRYLLDHGVRPGLSDHLVSEAVYLTDPDGLGIEVYADRPRETWRTEDGEIVMATERLDLDDLMQAARGSWNGMPTGTRVGHVHLHVGDLDRAAAFYRDAVGLETTVTTYPGALFLSAGGYHHHVGLNTWAGSVQAAGEDEARLLEWMLVVPGAGIVADRLAEAGFQMEDGCASDPWGTRLRLAEPAEIPST